MKDDAWVTLVPLLLEEREALQKSLPHWNKPEFTFQEVPLVWESLCWKPWGFPCRKNPLKACNLLLKVQRLEIDMIKKDSILLMYVRTDFPGRAPWSYTGMFGRRYSKSRGDLFSLK
jgi:hypothetical protein